MDDQSLRDAFATISRRMPASRAECPSPDDLQALATTAGDTPRRLEQLQHVATCGACRADFDLLRTAAQAAPALSTRRRMAWGPALAAAAVIAVVGTAVLRAPVEDDIVRGGADAPDFRIVTVADDRDSIAVVWTAVPQAVRYDVEALLDDASPAYSEQTTDTVAGGRRTTGRITRWTVTATLLDGTTRTASTAGR